MSDCRNTTKLPSPVCSPSENGSESPFPGVIELNVGGRLFETTLMTLTKYRDSMLGAMFSGQHPQTTDKHGRYFIDADGDTFVFILRWLRHQTLPPRDKIEEVYRTAEFFALHRLLAELDVMPEIVMKKVRAGHLSNNYGPDLDVAIRRVLQALVHISTTSSRCLRPRMPVEISVRHAIRHVDLGSFHHCASSHWDDVSSTWRAAVPVDVMLDPISSVRVTESVYVDMLVRELRAKGYELRDKSTGHCRVFGDNDRDRPQSQGETCGGLLFQLLFSWR